MQVTPEEIKEAYYHIRKEEGDALRFAAQRIEAFHERQRTKTWMYQDGAATLGQVVTPIDAVGVYVPGGKAVYPSIRVDVRDSGQGCGCAAHRDVHAASERWDQSLSAGCSGHRRRHGNLSRGRRASHRCDGLWHQDHRQSVDKIVGPGNVYVATAKRMLYGTVGIDMVAGPSELLVVADGDAKPAHVAADLLCEAEHDEDAQVYLVTTSASAWPRRWCDLIERQLKGLQREKIAAKSIAQTFRGVRCDDDG